MEGVTVAVHFRRHDQKSAHIVLNNMGKQAKLVIAERIDAGIDFPDCHIKTFIAKMTIRIYS